MARHLFTSESVTEGHPDKICDQISDAILDEILTHDPDARVACETCASTGLVHIMGEITTSCYVDFQKIVREVISDIGYSIPNFRFREASSSSSSVSDFLPKLRNFSRSLRFSFTRSPTVSTSAAFRQFRTRTLRS